MHVLKSLLYSLLLFPCLLKADVLQHFDAIKSDPNALYAFFKSMPKGGELHYHLAGGAYPETMITLAGKHQYCLNQSNFSVKKTKAACYDVSMDKVMNQTELYDATIRAWSMKNFIPTASESGHDHFFETFPKFLEIVSDFRPQLLAEVMQRAIDQNELYLEIMILPDNARSTEFGRIAAKHSSLDEKRKALLADKDFNANVTLIVSETTRILKEAKKELNCDQDPTKPVCNLTVKFQYYTLREQPLDNLFAQALSGFEAASNSSDLVGINLVQAEDGITSLRDYGKQMTIFNYFHEHYPKVHIALHAGELAPEVVKHEDLRFHIHDAIFIGQAERIGHGVDITYENNAKDLVKYMAKKSVPVEINLTSNQKILDIYGKSHPLNLYLHHQVPVVLSTDDEGILRTNLTREYVKAVIDHGLNYPTLKTITRNALTYSFLPGQSLWENSRRGLKVKACQNLDSPNCKSFIKGNEKARLQWTLEKKLIAFEKRFK
ncbi:adenosine deaminase family protein [Legionella yabuuchiae]|uniref:adenosine deaminase family protein n=1 Tax=Legionella yabuuchiae TaxID=376727 RepID=UPI0010557B4B|nr:adenosine deaminase [Legionella yabuuchiae]